MPFGLRNAAQTFQRFIHEVLGDLNFIYAYIDDLLIASSSPEEHEKHLHATFQRLAKYGLCVNAEKCVLGVDSVDFLGYKITAQGTAPQSDRIEALKRYPKPQTIVELRRFIGAVNFYRRHLKNAANVQAPLNGMLKESKKNDKRPVPWTPVAETAFETLKQQLAEATVIAHPDSTAQLRLSTDASSSAIGAALEQSKNNNWEPLGFFSKKLTPAQVNYSTYDRELTAIYEAIKFFRPWLEGREFSIATDHKPLIYAFQQRMDKASPRQVRQLSFISEFSTDIQYVAGQQNEVADAFSRIDAFRMPTTIDFEELAQAQEQDDEMKDILRDKNTSLQLRLTYGPDHQGIYCDVSTNDIRPFVPEPLRRKIYDTFHNLNHPSGRITTKVIAQRYVWPSMNRDITKWAKNCLSCQKSKVGRHVHTQPATFTNPDQRFDHVHIDLVGPLQESEGFKYVVTMVDRFTRWPEAIPIKDLSAETVANAFYANWIARFGSPKIVTTDQGTQFESALFTALSRLVGGKRVRTTAYHPPANGMVERWHRTLKTAIMCHATTKWTQILPTVLLGLRSCYKEELKASPAEFLYGLPLRVPGEFFTHEDPPADPHFFLEDFRVHIRNVKPVPASHHCKQKTFCYKDLYTCTHVFLRQDAVKKPLEQPYMGPFEIIERVNDRLFTILVNGRQVNVNIERLKPAYIPTDDLHAETTVTTQQQQSMAATTQQQQSMTAATQQQQSTAAATQQHAGPRTYTNKKRVRFNVD